jgi:DUF4097 and DUF4098 domain-containing protein YvlB
MSNQESMFADQEPRQRVNTDPRERSSEQAAQEGYRPYNESPQWDDGKIHPQQRPRRRGGLLAIIIVCAVVLLGGIFGYSAYTYSTAPTTVSPHTFNMSTANPTLVMNVGGGDVQIHTGTGNSIIVKETHRSAGFASSNDNVAYSQSGNTVTVQDKSDFGVFFGFNSQSFDVTLPATANLELQTGSGSVDVAGVNGQVNVQTGSGDITADNMSGQQATLKTGSGDVNLNNVSVQQDVLGTGSGSIDAHGLSGQVTLETGSGSTTIEQGALKGDSVLKAGSGDITYTGSLDANGNYRFETGSGDVDMTLPGSSAFNLDAHTGSGSVNNDFGSDQVGGSPRAPLSITTGSGDVDIHKG